MKAPHRNLWIGGAGLVLAPPLLHAIGLTWDNATGLEVDWTCNHLLVTRY